MQTNKTRVLIVGGGFGGVKVALELERQTQFDVTLLSNRSNFHYYPTLYHTATGGSIAQSSIPLDSLCKNKNITLIIDSADKLDQKTKRLITSSGAVHEFDVLVLGLGALPNYYGIKGIEEFSYSIVTPEEARRFKNHLHQQLIDQRKPDLNYVIVGGGPTGIELAGALSGYLREIMRAHGIHRKTVHIDLVEAAPKLVPRMPARMSKTIAERLKKLGVRLYLNQKVEGMAADSLTVNGKPIQSHTIVWNAGTKNSPFFERNGFALTERGKVAVDEYLQAADDIYVIGDNANTTYSGMAQTALYDALFVSENLVRRSEGKLMKRYTPKEPIYVIPVGHNWAAVLWGKVHIYGLVGWLLRLAADFVAFKDYQPWWKAGRQWLTEFQEDEDCLTCTNDFKPRKPRRSGTLK